MQAARQAAGIALCLNQTINPESPDDDHYWFHTATCALWLGIASDRIRDYFLLAIFGQTNKQYFEKRKDPGHWAAPFAVGIEQARDERERNLLTTLEPFGQSLRTSREERHVITHAIATRTAKRSADTLSEQRTRATSREPYPSRQQITFEELPIPCPARTTMTNARKRSNALRHGMSASCRLAISCLKSSTTDDNNITTAGTWRNLLKSCHPQTVFWVDATAPMSGIRQHTIPRFLLRGFTRDPQQGDGAVWYYRKGQPATYTGIKSVGVEKGFYDSPDQTSADEAITRDEPRFADLVRTLRTYSHTSPVIDARIPDLLVHLSTRTRALRSWTTTTFLALMEQATSHLLNPIALQQIVQNESLVRTAIAANVDHLNLPPAVTEMLPALITAGLPHLSADWFPDVQNVVRQLVDQTISEIPMQLRTGHNRTLGGLRSGPRNEAFQQLTWHVCSTATPLLLGDSALIVEIDGPQPFKTLNDAPDHLRAAYLPLGPMRVLVGRPQHDLSPVDVARLNDAIARCSYEFFVSNDSITDPTLHDGIGQWAGLLSRAEVEALTHSIKDRWPFNPNAPIPARFSAAPQELP